MELDEQLDIQRNSRYHGESNSLRPEQMIEEFSSPSLNNLKDSIEDALTSESPQDILDCIMLTLKRNSQYHRICARHSKEVLDLLYGVDKNNNVVEINAGALDDDYLTDPKKWIDYTELPDSGKVQTESENIGLFTEDELVAKGYQLTDTGWVKA
jgi:hypothetical protein